jgi:hypothetical protein
MSYFTAWLGAVWDADSGGREELTSGAKAQLIFRGLNGTTEVVPFPIHFEFRLIPHFAV